MLTLKLVSTMTVEEAAPHWNDIAHRLMQYCERYPHDENLVSMLLKCMAGRNQLWATLDENNKVAGCLISEIKYVDATGKKRFVFTEASGNYVQEHMELMPTIEQWARETHGCTQFELIGRRGWKPLIEPHGYKEIAAVFRKMDGD